MGSGSTTSIDNGAARASARDRWVSATREYFVDGCRAWRAQPEQAMSRIRPVVEGFVHIVCVELEPTFEPHERGELRRVPFDKALPIARRHLPPERLDLVDALKNLGNRFHHNQGAVQRSTPNMARAALLQCAELLGWMDRELLRAAVPQSYAQALQDLEGAAPVATPIPSVAAMVAGTPVPPAAPPAKKRAAGIRWRLLGGLFVGAVAVLAVLGFVIVSGMQVNLPASDSPEEAWVRAYESAIATRDPDRIVALHELPSGRFFLKQNQTAAQLRTAYDDWFHKDGKGRRTTFHDCKLVTVTTDGLHAERCEAHIEPALPSGIGVTSTCFVFRDGGRLVSRTESIGSAARCPPPPL